MSYVPVCANPILDVQETSSKTDPLPKPARASSPSRRRRKRPSDEERTPPDLLADYSIIIHCHLCWDWVWQRPQQFASRLSRRHKVLFVETLGPDAQLVAPLAKFRTLENLPNITVLRLQFPTWQWHDGDHIDAERRRLVQEFVRGPFGQAFANPVHWFYDPMAIRAFAGHMNEILTVYDCMDELSQFHGAPPEMVKREAELLACADVVFTGGRKLHESKSRFHPNCHFYGCGVEWEHFGRARDAQTEVPADLEALPKPVLGYFGVVDERMDCDLVAKLADANPHWSVVMIGPTIKIEPQKLPQRPNLHWLGLRSYGELPAYCKGFDLCLMPFARNAATEFINPTKALEYMATGRMIVSTAVPDVVRNFGSVVQIANSPAEFITLCRKSLQEPDSATIGRGLNLARENSWDSIVSRLEGHVEEALLGRYKACAHTRSATELNTGLLNGLRRRVGSRRRTLAAQI